MVARTAGNLRNELIVLAASGPEFAAWPLGLAGLPDSSVDGLKAQGVTTVGDFVRLSQARLSAVLGSAGTREANQRISSFIDWARGVAGVPEQGGSEDAELDLALKWQWLSRQPLGRQVLQQSLAELPFPSRAQNAFARMGTQTLDDLMAVPFATLHNTPNLGQVTLVQMVKVIEDACAGGRAAAPTPTPALTEAPAACPAPSQPRAPLLQKRGAARQGAYPWFATHEVAEGVHAISEPLGLVAPSFGVWWVNSYLVVGSRLAVLIDTGMGVGDIGALVKEITWQPVLVVNTHCHWDHVGGNSGFVNIAAHRYERRRLEQEPDLGNMRVTLAAGQRQSAIRPFLPLKFTPRDYRIRPSAATRTIAGRDCLDLGGRTLEVIHTPGHSPGSVCLFDRANHLLFTGDTLYAGTMWLHTGDADFAAFRESLARLSNQAMDINFILGGHNQAVSPTGLLWDAIKLSDAVAAHSAEGTPWGLEEGAGAKRQVRRYRGEMLSMLAREDV